MKKSKFLSLVMVVGFLVLVLPIVVKGDLNRSGEAYFEASPDSEYVVMRVYLNDVSRSYQMLMTPERELLFIKMNGRDTYTTNGAIWMYKARDNVSHDYVRIVYDSEIALPPSLFQRLYAWLFIHITGFDINKMEMKPLN
ncbi:hypothetical protein [Enterovibrio norvegicus]|uniref:hypothetical protein n=1 Tax=Enterovibrio norvegicus TaxID=188144 RepID=UPI0024B26BD9|nr:hypothetical protein [Enterovibrio norvegicus]